MMINDNKDDKQQELKRQTQLHSELIKGEVTAAQTPIWIAAATTLGGSCFISHRRFGLHILFLLVSLDYDYVQIYPSWLMNMASSAGE